MLTFRLYCDSYTYTRREIDIDPLRVESVQQAERRPPDSGWQQVAIITMQSGVQHIVYDDNVAQRIRAARAQVREEEE